MTSSMNRRSATALIGATLLAQLLPGVARGAGTQLVIGLQEGGTAFWEVDAMLRLGLPAEHGVELVVRPLADSRAGQIALLAGAVDVILSDFVWVSAQRHRGNMVSLVPHSLAVGGVVTRTADSGSSLDQITGKTIGVGGGPADKSWIILQAYYEQQTGRQLLADVEARFGAPPLVNEMLASGHVALALNYWHWNARAEAAGAREILSVEQMLAGLGVETTPPLLGWAFAEATARTRPEAVNGFAAASAATKRVLLDNDGVWQDLAPRMGAPAGSDLFRNLRSRYRSGIALDVEAGHLRAAEQLFAILVQYGGEDVVGTNPVLAEGTFWDGGQH
jgi:NitT/TauT family transport system substrate-binding protein